MSLLEKVIEANSSFADQYQVSFQLTHQLDNVHILADEDRMIQVLNNLMSNAVKFSSPGDTVELAVARHEAAIRISVTDHGPGIPESFHAKLFDRFTQSDSSDSKQKGGTGLGLSIVKAIVEKHGGLIDFITHEGIGTTMYVELPYSQVIEHDTPPQQITALNPHRPCLLIIEDDVDVAALLQRMLAEAGYNSDIAHSGEIARDLLRKNHNGYRAITLDIELPDINGLQLLSEIRNNPDTQSLPVVVISAKADEAKKQLNGGAVGITDWLNKPIDEQRLFNAIRTSCSKHPQPRILHVEDETDIHFIVKNLLDGTAQLEHAKTIKMARQALADNHFDLVLLDLALPDGSGLELIPIIDQCSPTTKLIIFSGHEVNDEQVDQVCAVLSKSNTDHQQLIQTISAALNSDGC